jgi:hypothetical protein
MATNGEVIGDSLRELGVLGETETLSPEQGLHGLRQLNHMVESWTEDGIELGYFAQSATADECPLPIWALRVAKLSLTVELAPAYGVAISPAPAAKVNDAYTQLVRKTLVENAQPASMDHMPTGAGHRGFWDITSG